MVDDIVGTKAPVRIVDRHGNVLMGFKGKGKVKIDQDAPMIYAPYIPLLCDEQYSTNAIVIEQANREYDEAPYAD